MKRFLLGIVLVVFLVYSFISQISVVEASITYLRYHDDGPEAHITHHVGKGYAVKFTPPKRIRILEIGTKFIVEQGTLNVPYKIHICDLDHNDLVTPIYNTTNGGWDWVDVSSYSLYIETDFFVAIEWLEHFNPYIGEDASDPDNRSWVVYFDTNYWYQEHDWDYMITVMVDDQLCDLRIESYPTDGIEINVNGKNHDTPYSEDFEYGTVISIDRERGVFDHWIDYHGFFSRDRSISYTIPSIGGRILELIYVRETDVPWHMQTTEINCGPASLETVFDFYDPDVSQTEIATVARTAGLGTNLSNMRRAAHFSNLSTEGGFNGYTTRPLGYAAFEYQPGTPWLGALKSLIDGGYPIIVNTHYDESEKNGHYRVAVDYDDYSIRLHDPWDPEEYGYSYQYGGAFVRMDYDDFVNLWERHDYWGLFVSPWIINITTPEVGPGDNFEIAATITYPCPSPFLSTKYSASSCEATITLPAGFSLDIGETHTKAFGSLSAGESRIVSWHAIASSVPDSYTITVTSVGTISESGSPYSYSDRIGGFQEREIEVTPAPTFTVYLESREDNATSSNLGTITFNGSTYSLPDNITKIAATYAIRYINADPSYVFDHWETTPEITVGDSNAKNTTATVSGDGNLTAIYKAAFVHGYSRIIVQHDLGGSKSLSLGIFGNLVLISLCFGGILSFFKGKHRRRNIILVCIFVLGALLVVGIYASVHFGYIVIPSSGRITGMELGAYWDSQCSNNASTIDWGPMLPASTNDVTLYLRNEGNVQITLSLNTSNWNPPETAFFATLSYNYTGQILNPGTITEVEFTLNVSENIGDTDIGDFMFDIIMCVH